ncbi:MAG: gliding motility protein GldL [Bacteroidales bacterium]|nr:gliding motility protein GldL [Bacteroidales bacterium]
MGISSLVRSKGFKNFMAKLYGWGAAVIMIGALFKIEHLPGATVMLIVGLLTEALIFFFSAFEPPHVEPDWSLVYPELAGMYEGYSEDSLKQFGLDDEQKSVSGELDKMLEDAKIGPELIESLGVGLRNLSDNAGKLTDISEASVATKEYTQNIRSAADNINTLSDAYVKTSDVLTSSTEKIAMSAEKIDFSGIDGQAFNNELTKVSNNLAALNTVYELQLQSSTMQSETIEKVGQSMNLFLENLSQSIDNTAKYKQQADELAKNVAMLNEVYGKMLNAMTVQRS